MASQYHRTMCANNTRYTSFVLDAITVMTCKQMNEFLKVNEGLARRIPYRYAFHAYSTEELCRICCVMLASKGERISEEIRDTLLPSLLDSIPDEQRSTQNAGIVSNLVSFAQIERDDRIDLSEAEANPEIASILQAEDFIKAVDKVKQMAVR